MQGLLDAQTSQCHVTCAQEKQLTELAASMFDAQS
jgi:hypothetical protein